MEFTQIAKGIWKTRIGAPERYTPVALRRFPMKEEALEKLPSAGLPKQAEQIVWRQNRRGLQIMLPMDSSEDIYGFGLQLKSMNQAGGSVRFG